MKVKQARDVARQWMVKEASRTPGCLGAYTAGSTNWLDEDTDLRVGSDLDIMVVLAGQNQVGTRSKFIYGGVLLEVSYLSEDQLQSPEQVLSDYHLAPSFRTTKVLFDPAGDLTPVLRAVCRDYAKRRWVRQRCANARNKILERLQSIDQRQELHDQVMTCLFAAGIATHVLLVAGLRNPTVRSRYVAVRELLADFGQLEFHETLLELLGAARLSREQVSQHLVTLTGIFDAAKTAIRTPVPFASDISNATRPSAIDGSMELITRGYHREATFWIAVTYSRCMNVLRSDAPEIMQDFREGYRAMAGDLGVSTFADIGRRCSEIESILPRLDDRAEDIIAANREVEVN